MATQFELYIGEELPQRAAYLTDTNTGYAGDPNLSILPKINDAPKGTWFLNDNDDSLWFKKIKPDPLSWEQLQGAQGSKHLLAYCDTVDAIGDAVYISGNKTGDYHEVRGVSIDDANVRKAIAIGIILVKPTDTVCIVQVEGPMIDIKTGMTPGTPIFVGSDASLIEGPPPRPLIGARIRQCVGYAIAANTFIVNISRPLRVRALIETEGVSTYGSMTHGTGTFGG